MAGIFRRSSSSRIVTPGSSRRGSRRSIGIVTRSSVRDGERSAEVTGRLRYTAASRLDFPAVGDWVALQPNGDSSAVIHAVLPRRTLLLRKAAGMLTEAQVIAANLDTLFIVTDVDKDFNPRRLERYLTLARESGVRPVIVLNKADLNARAADLVRERRSRRRWRLGAVGERDRWERASMRSRRTSARGPPSRSSVRRESGSPRSSTASSARSG